MLDLLTNAALQACAFGIGCIGVALSFRVVRYPDLTADGSFMIGGATFAAAVGAGCHWLVAAACACAAGMAAGILTAILSERIHITKLLSGILTTMICYSLSFRLLGGSPNRSVEAGVSEQWGHSVAGGLLLFVLPVAVLCLLVG